MSCIFHRRFALNWKFKHQIRYTSTNYNKTNYNPKTVSGQHICMRTPIELSGCSGESLVCGCSSSFCSSAGLISIFYQLGLLALSHLSWHDHINQQLSRCCCTYRDWLASGPNHAILSSVYIPHLLCWKWQWKCDMLFSFPVRHNNEITTPI